MRRTFGAEGRKKYLTVLFSNFMPLRGAGRFTRGLLEIHFVNSGEALL